MLAKFPATAPSQAQSGTITKICGQAQVANNVGVLYSPITNRPCVFYHVVVERLHRNDDGNHQWRPILREEQGVDFCICDQTSSVFVIAHAGMKAHAQVDGGERETSGFMGFGGQDPSPGLVALLARHGHAAHNFFGGNIDLRAREGVFAVGETIAALGYVSGNAPQLQLQPLQQDTLPAHEMQHWSEEEVMSWQALTRTYQCVILSDDPSVVGFGANGVSMNLPYAQPQAVGFVPQQQPQSYQYPVQQPQPLAYSQYQQQLQQPLMRNQQQQISHFGYQNQQPSQFQNQPIQYQPHPQQFS